MAKFRFRLEKLLLLREQNEKEWEIRLGEITSKCVQTRRKILGNTQSAEEILKDRAAGGTALENLYYSEMFIRRMRDENVNLNRDLEKFEENRARVQEKYLEASRERKTIEKLKEKKEREFNIRESKKEIIDLDDINNSAAIRKNLGGT